jgi:hypothetical protein
MRQLKTFSHVLIKSATSLRYYAEIIKSPFTFSLKSFLTVWFILATINAAIWIPKVYRVTKSLTTTLLEQLPTLYPQEMVIAVKDGTLSSNVKEPYYYPIDNFIEFVSQLEESVKGLTTEDPTYLVVIDTRASLDDFDLYHTYALVTDRNLIYYNDNGNLEVVSFKDFEDLTIDYQTIQSLIGQVTPFSRQLPTIVSGIAVIGLYAGTLWLDLVYLILLTVITWVVAKILRSRLVYSQSYQINLHTLMWYKIIFAILGWLTLTPSFPFLRTTILGLLHLAIVIKLQELQTRHSSQPDPAVITNK